MSNGNTTPSQQKAATMILDILRMQVEGATPHQVVAYVCDQLASERERCALVAEETTCQPMDYTNWPPGLAADNRARNIAAAIRALP